MCYKPVSFIFRCHPAYSTSHHGVTNTALLDNRCQFVYKILICQMSVHWPLFGHHDFVCPVVYILSIFHCSDGNWTVAHNIKPLYQNTKSVTSDVATWTEISNLYYRVVVLNITVSCNKWNFNCSIIIPGSSSTFCIQNFFNKWSVIRYLYFSSSMR